MRTKNPHIIFHLGSWRVAKAGWHDRSNKLAWQWCWYMNNKNMYGNRKTARQISQN
jgi:hypothetical protein